MSNLELKTNKNILLVSHNFEPEGATWSLFYVAEWLKKAGHEVRVISPKSGPLAKFYEEQGIPIKIADFYSKNYFFEDNDVDLIFVNTILGYRFILKLDVKKYKIIWCIRESEREVYFDKYKDLNKNIFKSVSAVLFVADATRKIYCDLDNSNFHTIHNGLNIKRIDSFVKNNNKNELRKKHGLGKKDFVFSILGAVCLRKGQLEFAEAAAKVLKETKNKILKFFIVGSRGCDYEKRIQEIIRQEKLENNIFVIQELPSVFEYYLMSDAYVCNSYIESFPRVILEAMAFKLPIISTNVYGIAEQIEDQKDGLLIMAGDTHSLAKKMKFLASNPEKGKKLGDNARKKVEIEFSYEVMIDKYKKLIESICAG